MRKPVLFVIAIVFVITFLVISNFIFRERQLQHEITENYLEEMTSRNTAVIRNMFDEYIDTLLALSIYIKNADNFKSKETLELLKNIAILFDFERLSIDFPVGKSYTTDGIILNITNREYLEALEKGRIFITDVSDSSIDGTQRICIQVPLYKNGIPVASLSYSLSTERISEAVATLLPDEYRYFYIIDEHGRYVSISSNENNSFSSGISFFDTLDSLEYSKGFSKEIIEQAFINGHAGHTEYSLDGVDSYGYYAPVGINNWVMWTTIPKDVVNSSTSKFITSSLWLSLQIALILVSASVFVYIDQARTRAKTELDERCFRILAERTGRVVIEWDFNEKIMRFSNFEETYKRKPPEIDLSRPNGLINNDEVYPDDSDIFKKMLIDFMIGRSIENVRFRLRVDDNYQYHSLSSVVVSNDNGKHYKSIGLLENIDSQVRKEAYLRKKANTDQLTGLYNKSAAEAAISEIIASSDSKTLHALLCIDLDNFKGINDTLGHLFGDTVLKELAEIIKKEFRKSDILGRFGGDEFIIFATGIPDKEFIEAKAARLNSSLSKIYYENGIECTVSASIGIAIFPEDGNTYKTLYEKADEASYEVKNSGKNSFSFVT